ncbi:MAG: NAD(P)-dependent oxidoreductase [Candidatus Omnitrophica bacterium]|nr:NAD(P)-dependent oxidoreductase [Candidatus Omnitrophota bacterium]
MSKRVLSTGIGLPNPLKGRVLLLGSTGKMGLALTEVFTNNDFEVIGKNSKDFDARDSRQVHALIKENKPEVVLNTVASLGLDPCADDPQDTLAVNTLYPKALAELSNEYGFLLVHFSTDAVFNDEKQDYYVESDAPHPLNLYGLTKYGADCLIQAIAKTYYIFRVSVLFGETTKDNQFVEKMLQRIKQGQKALKIAADIISSPTYSRDVAGEILRILRSSSAFGLYHIANQGKASLFELMKEIIKCLKLDAEIQKASYKDFPFTCIKNTNTPLKSEKIPSLRPWQDAVREYCDRIKAKI